MKKYSTLLGAAVVGLSASASFAAITLNVQTVAINTTLAGAGWVGYQLSFVADGTVSPGVRAWDFTNEGGGLVGNIGILGDLHQRWQYAGTGDAAAATPTGASVPANQANRTDSFWFTQANFIVQDPQVENSSGSGSPLADTGTPSTPGFDYGVGSFLHMSGTYNTVVPPTSANLAFIIVPSNVPTTIRGVVQDGTPTGVFAIDTTLNPGVIIPEPASLGLLALGGLSLLARRRRA